MTDINYQIKQYIQNNLNIIPLYWYIYKDITNPLLVLYNSSGLVNINDCYICQYILEYEGIHTRIYTIIFNIDNNDIIQDVLIFGGEDLTSILDESSQEIILTTSYKQTWDNYFNTIDNYKIKDSLDNTIFFNCL